MGNSLSDSIDERVETLKQRLNANRTNTQQRILRDLHASADPHYARSHVFTPRYDGVTVKGFTLSYIDKEKRTRLTQAQGAPSFGPEFLASYGTNDWFTVLDRYQGAQESIPTHSRWYRVGRKLYAANTKYWLVLEPRT